MKLSIYRIIKRVSDIIICIIFLLGFAPWLFIIIAIIIKVNSGGPVFFKQVRSGLLNKKFVLYKFRTLTSGDHSTNSRGKYQEITADSPDITKVGRILRKTGLDELPQFINILKGEMSVIGPRPHPISMDNELTKVVPHYQDRLQVKPGLTGWAQVNGQRGPARNPDIMSRRLKYDLFYIKHQSIWFDLKIFVLSVFILLGKIIG